MPDDQDDWKGEEAEAREFLEGRYTADLRPLLRRAMAEGRQKQRQEDTEICRALENGWAAAIEQGWTPPVSSEAAPNWKGEEGAMGKPLEDRALEDGAVGRCADVPPGSAHLPPLTRLIAHGLMAHIDPGDPRIFARDMTAPAAIARLIGADKRERRTIAPHVDRLTQAGFLARDGDWIVMSTPDVQLGGIIQDPVQRCREGQADREEVSNAG